MDPAFQALKPYQGPYSKGKRPLVIKKAWDSLRAQRSRCNSKTNPQYKWYGAKGIKVKYDPRLFIAWYIEESKKFHSMDGLVTSRIDHNGHYEFSNIKLETSSDNSKESAHRCNPLKRKVIVRDHVSGKILFIAKSTREASRLTSVALSTVWHWLKGHPASNKNGYTFEYHDPVR